MIMFLASQHMLLEIRLKDKQNNHWHRVHMFGISELIQGGVKDNLLYHLWKQSSG